MRRERLRVLAGVAAAAMLVSALSGCGLLFDRDAPASVVGAVDRALEQLRAVDGVASVSSTPGADTKDGGPLSEPAAWTVRISVNVAPNLPDLDAVAVQAERAFASVRRIVKTVGHLRIPADAQGAAAVLEFSGTDTDTDTGADAAESPVDTVAVLASLRAVAGATSVTVAPGRSRSSVSVASPSRWSGVAAAVRELPTFGSGVLSSVTVDAQNTPDRRPSQVAVEPGVPTPALIEILSDLAVQDEVRSVTYRGMAPRGDGRALYARPSLRIEVSSRAQLGRITGTLTDLDDAQATAGGFPRAAFSVNAAEGDTSTTRDGYLGRALGSGEPDDLIRPSDESTAFDPALAVVLEPTAAAARLEADRLAILALLTDAGDLAGIRGSATASPASCSTGAAQQVHGSVVIPIFEIADDAQGAFDAITASWIADGLTRSDRGMGTDIYSAGSARAEGPQRLAIRGTADGIAIRITGACIVTR